MGQEIKHTHYTKKQEGEFLSRLKEETDWLTGWIRKGDFPPSPPLCGYEAEGWIIDEKALPRALSEKLLKNLSDPHITPELSQCNFEINGNPCPVDLTLTSRLEKDFQHYWTKCSQTARRLKVRTLFIGTYPDLSQVPFGMKQIYPKNRYYAINDRIRALRKKPAHIHIQGKDTFLLDTLNIMREAETTSLQIHLQTDFRRAKDFYNSSLIVSPVMSALCANSPYVCGKELWEESRIPLFEQVISLYAEDKGRRISRVGLGHGFVKRCVSELFQQNLLHPVLLPETTDGKKEKLKRLLLHNGTVWRWNRPLMGFDENGNIHFRVEHRVPSAGPTLIDMQADILFFIGLINLTEKQIAARGINMTFQDLEESFYSACRFGLSAEIKQPDGKKYKVKELLLEKLIPSVWEELKRLSLANSSANRLINDVIKNRVESLQTGAGWQKAYIQKFGKKFNALVETYWQNQQKNIPVYQWKV